MKRLTILATTLAFVVLGPACKKPAADKDPSAAASASARSSAGGSGSAGDTAKESTPVASGVKFARKFPTVGAKHTEDTDTEMEMKLTMAGKVNEMHMSESSRKEEEILEFANNAIMKVRVTYSEDSKSITEAGKPAKAKPSAIAGKTYTVSSKDGKLTVLNDKGKPAPKPEASLVEKHYKSLGKPDPMLLAMPERVLKEGEEVPELSAALAKAMKEHDEKTTVDGAKVTFKTKEGDSGIFDVAVTIKSGAGPFRMSVPLKGTIALRVADAWPTTMELSGPLALEATEKEKTPGAAGGGTLKISSRYAYK